VLVARVEQLLLHVVDVVFTVLGKFHGDFLENHVVLGQCARFVAQHELNAPEFLRDCRVTSNGPSYFFIGFNLIFVEKLSEVQIDAHRYRDNSTQEKNNSEELEVPIAVEPISCDYQCRDYNHEDEENLGKPVDLHVKGSNLLPRG
jgi:hypothetical protein